MLENKLSWAGGGWWGFVVGLGWVGVGGWLDYLKIRLIQPAWTWVERGNIEIWKLHDTLRISEFIFILYIFIKLPPSLSSKD
jgi:hypothetical protein